jgi:hypothetical protein
MITINMTISQDTVCLGFLKEIKKMDLPVMRYTCCFWKDREVNTSWSETFQHTLTPDYTLETEVRKVALKIVTWQIAEKETQILWAVMLLIQVW